MAQDRKVVLTPKEFVQIGGTDYSLISNYIPQVFTLALMVSTFHCEECPHDVTVSNPGFKYLGSNSVSLSHAHFWGGIDRSIRIHKRPKD